MNAVAIHNARITLVATLLNNLAAAFSVAGFVAPAVGGQLNSAGRFIVAVVWIAIAAGLNSLALAILGGLKQ